MHKLVVSPAQKAELKRIARQSRSGRSVAFRARIILECARGASNAEVAAKLHTTGFTVGVWRNSFIAEELVGLGDEPILERRVRSVTRRSNRLCG